MKIIDESAAMRCKVIVWPACPQPPDEILFGSRSDRLKCGNDKFGQIGEIDLTSAALGYHSPGRGWNF